MTPLRKDKEKAYTEDAEIAERTKRKSGGFEVLDRQSPPSERRGWGTLKFIWAEALEGNPGRH
jgi:hypothetical protein